MNRPDVLVTADGRMLYETLRGRNKQIAIREADDTYIPLKWYDKCLYVPEGMERPEEVPPEIEGKTYVADPEIFKAVLHEAIGTRSNVQTVFLINSYGGLIGPERMMEQLAIITRETGGKVYAYVSTVAVSAGSAIMQHADEIHVLENSWCMWHLPDYGPNYRERIARDKGEDQADAILERHNQLRHEVHLRKLEALERRAALEHQSSIRSEIDRVMKLSNVRHELSFSGTALKLYGIAETAHSSASALEQHLHEKHGLRGRDAEWLEDPVSRFFLFSRIEEKLREMYGFPLKILLGKNGLLFQSSFHDFDRLKEIQREAMDFVQKTLSKR